MSVSASTAADIIANVKYTPCRVAIARVLDLTGGVTNEFSSLPYLERTPYFVVINNIAADRNTNVRLHLEGKQHQAKVSFDAETLSLFGINDVARIGTMFSDDVMIGFFASAPVSNYRARVDMTVVKPSLADRLAIGITLTSFEENERMLISKYQIDEKLKLGRLPMTRPEGTLRYAKIASFAGNLSANDEVTLFEATVPSGMKVVLRKLWCTQPGTNYTSLFIRVYHERELFYSMHPYAFPDFPTSTSTVDVFIPALRHMRVTLLSTTGHSGINAGALYEVRELTIWDKLEWGIPLTDEERDMVDAFNLREKLLAGIYEETIPIRKG